MNKFGKLRLIGENGNAFFILGAAQSVARKNGVSEEDIDAFMEEAMSDDYDHLIQTVMKNFEVY